ncbi:MAG: redoxin domain-containing protein [bacterium]|nr:MAG: redoxin domain-containing protein [bacterium]
MNAESIILKANEFYQNGEYEKALNIVDRGISQYGDTDKLIHTKYKILLALKKYDDALNIFDLIIERVGDSPDVVIDKIRLLINLKRYEEALETAMAVDKKYGSTSQYISLSIASIYLAKQEKQNTLIWLEKSVKRGFNDYNYLLSEEFKSLHTDEKFKNLIEKMKKQAGIGQPAKFFSITKFHGGVHDLSKDIGKVILLDFWATWCPPCVAEHPNLIKLYQQFKEQGFEIISISADSKRGALEKFMVKNKIPWINGFSGKGREDEIVNLYKIDSFPTYIVIDKMGLIRFISSEGGEKLDKIITELTME